MAKMAEQFPLYKNISITETHHTQKKDAPSGTAVSLANDILKNISRLKKWESNTGDRSGSKDQAVLPVHSLRIGDAAGIHEVVYESEDDSIKLIHEAKGRSGFAKGAVAAAEWLAGRKGVFGMKDLLQL